MRIFILFLLIISGVCASQAQSVLVPYRSGKLWGLADTNGVVVKTPEYDIVEANYIKPASKPMDFLTPFFVVKSGEKYGVLKGTEVILKPEFNRLHIDSTFLIELNTINDVPAYTSNRYVVRNFKGEVLFTDSLLSIEALKNPKNSSHLLYKTWGHSQNSGMFWYDAEKQEIIQWIIQGKYNNDAVTNSKNGNIIVYVKASEKENMQMFELLYNSEKYQYDLIRKYEDNVPDRTATEEVLYSGRYIPGSTKYFTKKVSFVNKDSTLYRIQNKRFSTEKNVQRDTITLNIKADSIRIKNYVRWNSISHHKYDNYSSTENKDKFVGVNFLTYHRNGKIGAVVDSVNIPPLYDDFIYLNTNTPLPYFIVSMQFSNGLKKWGVINADHKIVIPVDYEEIIMNEGSYNWIVKRNRKYGMVNKLGKQVLPVKYDQIILNENTFSYKLVAEGKYGYYSPGVEWLCEPVFPYPYKVERGVSMGNYLVFSLIDDREEYVGFGNNRGVLFFED